MRVEGEHRMNRRLVIIWIALSLAAALTAVGCQPTAPAQPTAVPPTGAPISWQRDAAAIVFRADRVSDIPASLEFAAGIPDCTVYGDNRVVWINTLGPFETQVLYDRVSDERILEFVQAMTVSGRLYTFQVPTPDPANPGEAGDVAEELETLTMAISGLVHETDARSGWGADYYEQALNVCKTLSATPVLFEPIEGAWLTAIPDPAASPSMSVTWDAAALGVALADAVSAPRWVTTVPAVTLWRHLRTQPDSFTLDDGGVLYRIVLQVPGITRSSPPAPGA